MNKVSVDSIRKENLKKTREFITPTIDTVKLCASKCSIERSQGQRSNHAEVEKSDLVEL